jgi:hypothetical protein
VAILAMDHINFFPRFMLSWRFLSWNLEAKKNTGIKKPANKIVFLITKILDKS